MFLPSNYARPTLAIGLLGVSLATAGAAATDDNVSGYLSLDFNSHFMAYGLNTWGAETEDIGDEFLFQPSIGLEFALPNGSAVYTGLWADVNDLADGDLGRIQEVDVWIGYYFPVGDFLVDFAVQQWYTGGETEGIFDAKISHTGAFSPYLLAHTRFESIGNQNKGTLFEVGATLYETSFHTVEVSVPFAVGFSFDDFHADDEEGYAYSKIGLDFAMPLGIPEGYGAWDLHGGLTYWQTDRDYTGNAKSGYLTASLGAGVGF